VRGGEINTNDVQALQTLQEPDRTIVLTAYTDAITDIFLYAMPIIFAALVVVLFLKEIPLRTRVLASADAPKPAPTVGNTGPARRALSENLPLSTVSSPGGSRAHETGIE
jgi:hypothetical protein